MRFTNISVRFLFLIVFTFTMAACHSLRPVSSGSSQTKKSPLDDRSALRKDLVRYASQQEGAKYKYGAHGPKKFDCSGFTCFVYHEYNVALPSGSYNQARLGKKISIDEAKPGDLVFFGKGGKVNHVALVFKNTRAGLEVVHSTSSRGVIKENVMKSSYWKSRILYVRDVIGG